MSTFFQTEATNQTDQVRVGRLSLYSLDTSGDPHLNVQTEVDVPGILDIKWSYVPIADQPAFALVNSIGQLRLYKVNEDSTVAMVTEEELGPQSLGLSLEWNNMTGCGYCTPSPKYHFDITSA